MKRSVQRAATSPAAPPRSARRHDSVSSCVTSRRRVAPSESRTAISDARPADRASSRFAMFAHAISRTTPVTPSRSSKGTPTVSCIPLCPRRPSLTGSGFATNRSRSSSLRFVWSGASTSVRMLRYRGRDRGAGLLDGDLRPQAREQVEPVVAAVLEAALGGTCFQPRVHREGHEHHGRHVERRAAEARRGHADDGQRLAVDHQHLSEHVARPAESGLPEFVTQHGDRMPADRVVDFRTEQPPQRRHEVQRREIRAGDLHALGDVEGAPLIGNAGGKATVRHDAREHGLFPLQITEHRVAEQLVATALAGATDQAGLGARGLEIHQPFRLDDRQRTQQELAVEREDRGVRPDAEGQRSDRHAHDHRGLDEHAQRQSKVLPEIRQELPPVPVPLPAAVDVDARRLDAPVVSEAPGGLRPRLDRVVALLHQSVDELVDVKCEFRVDVGADVRPPEPQIASPHRHAGHQTASAARSTLPMAAANAVHPSASLRSRARPPCVNR